MEKELIRVIKTLNKHRIKYLLIGGYAAILYGVKRSTFDIDILVGLSHDSVGKTTSLLSKMGFVRIPPNVSNIDPYYGMRFINNTIILDLMYLDSPIFDNLYRYHTPLHYKGTIIKMPNIMDLVSLKETSSRTKDIQDAIELRNIASTKMNKR